MIERRSPYRVMTIRDRPAAGSRGFCATMSRERRDAPIAVSLVSMAQFTSSEPLELMEAMRRDFGGMDFPDFDRCVQDRSGVNVSISIRGVNRPDPKRAESCESAFRHDLLRATEKDGAAILFDDFDAARWEIRRFVEDFISRTVLSDRLERDPTWSQWSRGTREGLSSTPRRVAGGGSESEG